MLIESKDGRVTMWPEAGTASHRAFPDQVVTYRVTTDILKQPAVEFIFNNGETSTTSPKHFLELFAPTGRAARLNDLPTLEQVKTFINGPKGRAMCNLANRWTDEKEYEDFADYERFMSNLIPHTWEFVKATKRPFGFQAVIGNLPDNGKLWKITVGTRGNTMVLNASEV